MTVRHRRPRAAVELPAIDSPRARRHPQRAVVAAGQPRSQRCGRGVGTRCCGANDRSISRTTAGNSVADPLPPPTRTMTSISDRAPALWSIPCGRAGAEPRSWIVT